MNEMAQGVLDELREKMDGMRATTIVEIHLGRTAFDFLKWHCSREAPPLWSEKMADMLLGIDVFADLEDPLAWSIETADGAKREGVLRPYVVRTDMRASSDGDRAFLSDYFIEQPTFQVGLAVEEL